MILFNEKVNEKAVQITISIFDQIGCLPSMVGSTMEKMSNGNPMPKSLHLKMMFTIAFEKIVCKKD
jgi:hypothetical protein